MSQDATVNAGEIARLVDVGRAAVSNWRRRHEDFPRPVGGTASSPLFSLREVEEWLRRNGKSFEVSLADRTWQRLRAAGDDLSLGRRVGDAGAVLVRIKEGKALGKDPELTELAAERGHAEAFEFLCERYLEAHSRRLFVTSPEVASLMVRLTCPDGGTLLDPACGVGTLLLETPAARVLGQDVSETTAPIAASRLRLRGIRAEVVTADSLRQDGFPGEQADAVVCDPPFNERAWGYDELTSDPRWEYGLPPRGESELAWVQHCLAHVKPGGLVAILMPATAASRRPGKRIRGNLLRAGALKAVITLSPSGPDLWLLRRPAAGDRPPSRVLLLERDLSTVESVWRDYLRDPETDGTVAIIDLLDDDVDLSPARHRPRPDLGRSFTETVNRFRGMSFDPPDLVARAEQDPPPNTTIGELVKAGLVTVQNGEVMVVDPERLDPDFLAGALRSAPASSLVDLRRTRLPRLSLDEQRAYGRAFRRLAALEDALRETAALGETLVRLGFDGLIDGRLRPGRDNNAHSRSI